MAEYNKYPPIVYAGFWMRLFAYTLDMIIVASLQQILLIFLENGTVKTALALVIILGYFVLMTKLNQGQTLGKMAFGLRVVCFNEEELSWLTIIVRELFGRYLQSTMWIMYVLVAFTPYKQHIVDLLTDTTVVSENAVTLLNLANSLMSPLAEGDFNKG